MLTPFDPQRYYDQYSSVDRSEGNYVKYDSLGRFSEESSGWFIQSSDVHAVGRAVSLYFHRDEELDNLPELQLAKKSYADDEAKKSLKARKANSSRTVSTLWGISESHLKESKSTVHLAEVEVLRAVLNQDSYEIIGEKVSRLMDSASSAIYHRDLNWRDNVKSFLAKEEDAIRRQCAEHLSTSVEELPEEIEEKLGELKDAINTCTVFGSKGFNNDQREWAAFEKIQRYHPYLVDGLEDFQFAREHRLIVGFEEDICSCNAQRSQPAIERFVKRLHKAREVEAKARENHGYPFGASPNQEKAFILMKASNPRKVVNDDLKLMRKWLVGDFLQEILEKVNPEQNRMLFLARLNNEKDNLGAKPKVAATAPDPERGTLHSLDPEQVLVSIHPAVKIDPIDEAYVRLQASPYASIQITKDMFHERVRRIEASLLQRKLIAHGGEFEELLATVNPVKLLEEDPLSFVDQVEGFRLMQVALRKPVEIKQTDGNFESLRLEHVQQEGQVVHNEYGIVDVTFDDCAILVNNSLFSRKNIQNLREKGFDVVASRGLLNLLDQQKTENLVDVGFSSWASTCWMNIGLHSLIRMTSAEMLDQLEGGEHRDPDLNAFKNAFVSLVREGHAVAAGQKPARVITDLQTDFIRACQRCARAKKLGALNAVFNNHDIETIKQGSASELVDSTLSALGFDSHSRFSVTPVFVKKAQFNKKEFVSTQANEVGRMSTLICFAPTEHDMKKVCMSDWLDGGSDIDERVKDWTVDELKGESATLQRLNTKVSTRYRVDTKTFKRFQISVGDTPFRGLCKGAFMNDGGYFEYPVLDENNQEKIACFKLNSIVMHAGEAADNGLQELAQAGLAGGDAIDPAAVQKHGTKAGHYMMLGFGEHGKVVAYDDFRSVPLEVYADLRGHGTDDWVPWRKWEDMMTRDNYAPSVALYDVVGFKDPD